MSIEQFILNQVFRRRLEEHQVLVVYDPDGRYRDLCSKLADDRCTLVDASGSSIESRDAALAALQRLGPPAHERELDSLVIHVPVEPPKDDRTRQRDPFSSFAAAGTSFPYRDADEYLSLCLQAKPDDAEEIRALFGRDPSPPFATVDAIGGNVSWPALSQALDGESSRELLLKLLSPSPREVGRLDDANGWEHEAASLIQRALGVSIEVSPGSLATLVSQLWQVVLFSEFVFDLPEDVSLPTQLQAVPCATPDKKTLIYSLAEELRRRSDLRTRYYEQAESVESTLDLARVCDKIVDLGERDTFAFEERTFFQQAIDALERDNLERLHELVEGHHDSIWVEHPANEPAWRLLLAAKDVAESADRMQRELGEHQSTMLKLVHFYAQRGRELDFAHRLFLAHVTATLDVDRHLSGLLRTTRSIYTKAQAKIHTAFMRHLKDSGWEPAGLSTNRSLFDRLVAPRMLDTGTKTAIFLIDALRYELGHELQKVLADEHQVTLSPSAAPLPSVTPYGMAALLPEAESKLEINRRDDRYEVSYDGDPLKSVNDRMGVLKSRFGDRFDHVKLSDLARDKVDLSNAPDLLVVRSNDIDEQFELSDDLGTALSVVTRSLNEIRASLRRLQAAGFDHAVICTDHGFVLPEANGVGDVCQKPTGNWINVHDRCLLGAGNDDPANLVVPVQELGIPGDFHDAALPKALVPYRKGLSYFHGGASLQELVVPVLEVTISPPVDRATSSLEVTLKQPQGRAQITTLRPSFLLSVSSNDLFDDATGIELLVEAVNDAGDIVGELKPGERVDPTTQTIKLHAGEALKLVLAMNETYEGEFTVRAVAPETRLVLTELRMKTDYTL